MDFEPKIYRTIIFVRHGQYQKNPEALTVLGKKQAKLTAKTLRPLKALNLYSSTMARAQETAEIIGRQIGLKFQSKEFFCEGLLPGAVEFTKMISKNLSAKEKKKQKAEMTAAKLEAEKAFKFIFKQPQKGQACEIVVAHGNVIRFWVCKALKINSAKWHAMDVSNCSITTVRIDKKGNLMLLGFSDVGHLPHKMRSYV